ncbi:MAG: ankyrin repeat domain-containing protein [Nitrososphaerales archaeon]
MHQNRTDGCTKDAMDFAAASGHLEIVEWLQNVQTGSRNI